MSAAKPHRPMGITILALLALLAALAALLHTLQMLHILPFFLGPVRFFSFDLIGAIVWGVMTALYAWLFRMLWIVNLRGWLFVIILAVLNLVMAGFSILGASTLSAMLPSLIINVIILVYALSPGVKDAFDWEGKRS